MDGYGSFPVNGTILSHGQMSFKVLKFATAEDKESYFTPKILGNMAVLSKDGAFSATVNGNHLIIQNLSDNSIEDFLLPDMLFYSEFFKASHQAIQPFYNFALVGIINDGSKIIFTIPRSWR